MNPSSEGGFARGWQHVLDLGLALWILRGPLVAVAIGSLLLLKVPQSQDLLVEAATDPASVITLVLLLILVWAMPTHYAARLLLETDERFVQQVAAGGAFRKWLQKWAPRILGALTILAMIGAAFRSRFNVPGVSNPEYTAGVRTNLLILASLLVVALIPFWVYTLVRRGWIARLSMVQGMERLAHRLLSPFDRLLQPLALSSARTEGHDGWLGPVLLLLLFLFLAILPMLFPYEFAWLFPRAAAVPFVMGGWLPLLALLAGLGRRYRVPFIMLGLFILVQVPYWTSDNYQVRTITAAAPPKIDLNEAVQLWKRANQCENPCPRPIIIAAAGGASRAGFFTASVVGQLLDGGPVLGQKKHGRSAAEVRNRIFAFSTVSGSSVGAVMATAALDAAAGDTHPCKKDKGAVPKLWHGFGEAQIDNWRSCLEALMSGDFLTPIFIGFTFHDPFRFLGWQDRGVLLERSLEEQFKSLIVRPGQTRCVGNLECPFTSLRPSEAKWLPLLVLNSTSVKSGQRIITTLLEPTFEAKSTKVFCPTTPREPRCQLFAHGEIFHKLLEDGVSGQPNIADVRLSTAAHNSARFPLLSPPGEIMGNGGFVDRIVDGGYFENLGAQTATELAEAIMAVDDKLQPFILVISNDPRLAEAKSVKKPPQEQTVRRKPDSLLLTDVSAPITAFANTRNARGVLAVADITAILDFHHQEVCNVAHIQVRGEPDPTDPTRARDLSWSWWLSKPVQIYLHEQTNAKNGVLLNPANETHIGYLLSAFEASPSKGSPGPEPKCPID
jgi:hypothetical protein